MKKILSTTAMMAGALTAALALATPATAAETTLKFIPQADLRILDPIWTTAYDRKSVV